MHLNLDEERMQLALNVANESASVFNEVPVGAVLFLQDTLVASGGNRVISNRDPTAHAEVMVLRQAGQILNNYRLPNTTLYVTLEPCLMCLSAIFHARIARVVYGATDNKTGACGGYINMTHISLNHHTTIIGGVLKDDCALSLQAFFKQRRIQKQSIQQCINITL